MVQQVHRWVMVMSAVGIIWATLLSGGRAEEPIGLPDAPLQSGTTWPGDAVSADTPPNHYGRDTYHWGTSVIRSPVWLQADFLLW